MPYSLVLHCFPTNGSLSDEDLQGQKALALLLQELIQKQDAALAARLHAPGASRPFTTAILTGERGSRGRGSQEFDAAPGEIKIRITLLRDALYPLVVGCFLGEVGKTPMLKLGRSTLMVMKVTATPESGELWSAFASFEELLDRASEAEATWTLRFHTPTCFKVGDALIPLPVPRLCVQSWLRSWEAYSPRPLLTNPLERRHFLEVVEGTVSVTYTRLRLAYQDYSFDGTRTREAGFVGVCQFSVKPAKVDPQHRRLLTILTDYSFYCGTGRKTTMGMGVTKPINPGRD